MVIFLGVVGDMIKNIKPFIDLKWHTVPLEGKLKRLANGKKTLPIFQENWKELSAKEFNTKVSPLGGALTGSISDIIAIDCDNTITYNMFRALDPEYKFHFVSKSKKNKLGEDQTAAIIVYKYSDEVPDNFILKNNTVELDFYSNGGFIYLPTEANKTKEPFDLTEIKEAPAEIIALLKSIKPVRITQAEAILNEKNWQNHLGPQIANFVHAKKVIPSLFKILTPKDFRDMDEYQDKGYLHPEDVPEGRGSEYLSKISAILGADVSIDVDLYIQAIEVINEFFSEPMPKTRLSATVIEPMVEERSSIEGKPIWQYDEMWQDGKLQLVSKRNEIIDTFYDPRRLTYYAADVISGHVKGFNRDADFVSYIETIAIDSPSRKEIKQMVPLVDVVSTPAKSFGFFLKQDENAFNTFYPSESLTIFRDPSLYTTKYARPNLTLQFLETLVPDNYMRNYLLKFLRRKLDKFEYSPVVLYFLGVPGAGKDTFVKIVERIIGASALARPTVKEFLEMYNGWMLDKYFIQLDEYGNQLTRFDDKENALGKIKAYTGKEQVQIRQMRTDGFNYIHSATFIMTANKNPLFVEGDDRRMALFDCPNKLSDAIWVQQAGGVTEVLRQIDKELNDFIYYLATEVDNLSPDAYQSPPDTEDKKRLIASKFGAAQRLSFLLQHQMFHEVEILAKEYGSHNVFKQATNGRIQEEDLFDLYYEMTDGKGTKRGLSVSMKEFTKVPTTYQGQKAYYYEIPQLARYKLVEPFGEIDDEN